MNNKERRVMTEFPSEGLDAAVKAEFGEETMCETSFNIVEMKHVTWFAAKGQKKKDIDLFVKAFIAGNQELSGRLDQIRQESGK